MVRGDTLKFTAAVKLNGTPVNLTGATIWMTAKWSPSDPDNLSVFQASTTTYGIVVTSAADGLFLVAIPPNITTPLPARKVELFYDIQMKNAATEVFTVAIGNLVILPDVTITS